MPGFVLVPLIVVGLVVAVLTAVAIYDVTQRRHAILRNFPIIGHFRFWLESIGPELRQYIVTSNTEELPFNRDQRTWIYASAKEQNNYHGFGTSEDLERSPNFIIIKHSAFPLATAEKGAPDFDPDWRIPAAIVLGAHRKRKHAFRPESVVNISGMSYGALSPRAIEALNMGANLAGCLHNTGEGGISPYHLNGGELIWQLGTAYFGARDDRGRFDMSRFRDSLAGAPVRAIEVKLSQGAKPGVGGLLPAAKITPEISEIRGIPLGIDCHSPNSHPEFSNVDTMLDFVERLADETGLPVGIKAAVGDHSFFGELALQMSTTGRGVDFITIDGGEGGTGAGPLVFTDHVALPFKMAMARVYREFAEQDMATKVAFIGSGKLGFPESALLAFALGCDMVNVGREAMMAVGCIQAQRCHTGHCPTGVATQSKWLMRGLDPSLKSVRLANYVVALRKDLLGLSRAIGVPHPSLVSANDIEILDEHFGGPTASEVFNLEPGWGLPSAEDQESIRLIMAGAPDAVKAAGRAESAAG
ncbi:MAG: FMN-binding glutamate synthase family protein [Dehalococcoidia bacterium]